MTDTIQLAVVGHTNAGKTSLLRTLTRHPDFGEVSARPGTTRHVESIDLKIDNVSVVRFFDTPGLEDSAALMELLKAQGEGTPPERIRAFLAGEQAQHRFEQEAKVLRALLEVDAAIYVIDTREPDLPKFRYEIEILSWCGKPIMPVLNFVRASDSRKEKWLAILAAYNLHTFVDFDAVAPFIGSELRLFDDLTVLLRRRESQLKRVVAYLKAERSKRREAACELIADTLVSLAALRRSIERRELADSDAKEEFIGDFQRSVLTRVRRGITDMLRVYGFKEEEADDSLLPWLNGQWEQDLFDPQSLQDAAKRLGGGAAVGMAVGLVADIAFAGLTLGTGTALGAALGGLGNQNWRQLTRRAYTKVFNVEDMVLRDEVLLLTAECLLNLVTTLEERGHAATSNVTLRSDSTQKHNENLQAMLKKLQAARGRDEWEYADGETDSGNLQRARLVAEIRAMLGQFVD